MVGTSYDELTDFGDLSTLIRTSSSPETPTRKIPLPLFSSPPVPESAIFSISTASASSLPMHVDFNTAVIVDHKTPGLGSLAELLVPPNGDPIWVRRHRTSCLLQRPAGPYFNCRKRVLIGQFFPLTQPNRWHSKSYMEPCLRPPAHDVLSAEVNVYFFAEVEMIAIQHGQTP